MHQDHAATGMGLYLSKKSSTTTIDPYRCKIKIGKGTTFTLTFPQQNEFVHITGM